MGCADDQPDSYRYLGVFQYKLVGFNNRRYDNHILLRGIPRGMTMLCCTSCLGVLLPNTAALFGGIYNLSYADIYDFSSGRSRVSRI